MYVNFVSDLETLSRFGELPPSFYKRAITWTKMKPALKNI